MIEPGRNYRLMCRKMTPGIVALLLVIVGAVNIPLSGLAHIMPMFPVMVVFYWSIYWPEVLPRWYVFLLGLFYDVIHALPPGISSLLLLLLCWVVTAQRRHLLKEPFIIIWLAFGICAGVYAALEWLGQSLYYRHLFTSESIAVRLGFSVLCYPVIHKMFNNLHRAVAQK